MEESQIQQLFYIGDYPKIAQGVAPKDEEGLFLFYRAHIQMGSSAFVISQVKNSQNAMQKGIKLLAQASACQNIEQINQLIPTDDSSLLSDPRYSVCKAIVYTKAEQISEALKTLVGVDYPEASAIRIHCYIIINRIDLARSELEKMTDKSILKIVWTAIVNIRGNSDQIQESLYSLQDLMESISPTPFLQNAIACCHYAQDGWSNGLMEINSLLNTFPNDEAGQINKATGLASDTNYDAFLQQMTLLRSIPSSYNSHINELLKEFDNTAERLSSE